MYPKWRGICGILTLTASLAIMGCGNNNGNANVRAVNASTGFAPFTYQVGQIGIAAGLPYGTEGVEPKANYATNDTSGAYRIVGAGINQTVSTYATPGTTLATGTQTLLKNGYYSVVSFGASPTMGLAVLTDDDTAPPSGQYKLRFVNYSSYAAVDVYIVPVGGVPSGNPTIGNVGVNDPVYLPLAPGTLSILVTPTGDPSTVLSAAAFSPAAGDIYSVFFVSPNPGQPPPNPGDTGYGISIVNDPVAATTTTSSGS